LLQTLIELCDFYIIFKVQSVHLYYTDTPELSTSRTEKHWGY